MTTARLEARGSVDVHALLKRAAEVEGRTLTDFVVASASAAAHKTIEDAKLLRLSAEDQQRDAWPLLRASRAKALAQDCSWMRSAERFVPTLPPMRSSSTPRTIVSDAPPSR